MYRTILFDLAIAALLLMWRSAAQELNLASLLVEKINGVGEEYELEYSVVNYGRKPPGTVLETDSRELVVAPNYAKNVIAGFKGDAFYYYSVRGDKSIRNNSDEFFVSSYRTNSGYVIFAHWEGVNHVEFRNEIFINTISIDSELGAAYFPAYNECVVLGHCGLPASKSPKAEVRGDSLISFNAYYVPGLKVEANIRLTRENKITVQYRNPLNSKIHYIDSAESLRKVKLPESIEIWEGDERGRDFMICSVQYKSISSNARLPFTRMIKKWCSDPNSIGLITSNNVTSRRSLDGLIASADEFKPNDSRQKWMLYLATIVTVLPLLVYRVRRHTNGRSAFM